MVNPLRKRYLAPETSVARFFSTLSSQNVKVVVLRWFDDLPSTEPGRDLDILVPDAAIPQVEAFLNTWPRGQRVDCYSETGLSETGYLPHAAVEVPAFPPEIARQILRNALEQEGGWWIPAPRDHALALAYHAVYLKGYASGLAPDPETPPSAKGSHDYAAVLAELADQLGIALDRPVTMRGLDRMLAREGWRPQRAHLEQLAAINPWIASELL